MSGLPLVSIIIVNYRSAQQLHRCLNSIREKCAIENYEIIIVDNEGNEILADQLRGRKSITYLVAGQNLGYGGGNNLGADHAAGKYLLFLNPDVIVKTDIVSQLSNYLSKHSHVGAVAPTLLHTNGQEYIYQGSGPLTIWTYLMSHTSIHRLWPQNPVARRHYLANIDGFDSAKLAAIPGCAMMIGRELFHTLGRFDARFFLYFEEWDFGRRISRAGLKLVILPEAIVIHDQKKEDIQVSSDLNKIYRKSRFEYFKKYGGLWTALLVEALFFCTNWRIMLGLMVILVLWRSFILWVRM